MKTPLVLIAALVFPSFARADVWHVVSFRFKSDKATQTKVPDAVKAFEALEELCVDPKDPKRKLLTSFHHGTNNSEEQLSFGKKGTRASRANEHTFIMTFDSLADRDYYVEKDPQHDAFKKLVGPLLEGGAEGVFVTDFEE